MIFLDSTLKTNLLYAGFKLILPLLWRKYLRKGIISLHILGGGNASLTQTTDTELEKSSMCAIPIY